MRRSSILVLAILVILIFLGFGCTSSKNTTTNITEKIKTQNQVDFDKDGVWDYATYDFQPYQDGDLTVQRSISVSAQNTVKTYSTEPNGAAVPEIEVLLDDFTNQKQTAETECRDLVGLRDLACDETSCARLCSANSVKCKELTINNNEIVTQSLINYQKSLSDIRTQATEAKRDLQKADMKTFAKDISSLIDSISDIKVNPIYQKLGLCTQTELGETKLTQIKNYFGTMQKNQTSYTYYVTLDIQSSNQSDVFGVTITDNIKVPITKLQSKYDIGQTGQQIIVKTDDIGSRYLIFYEFTSQNPPSTVIDNLSAVTIVSRDINGAFLAPTLKAVKFLTTVTGNYLIALGLGIGFGIILVFIVYNILIFILRLVLEKGDMTKSLKRVLGRADGDFRMDFVLGVVAGIIAFYFSTLTAPITKVPAIGQIGEVLVGSGLSALSVPLATAAILLIYFAVEIVAKRKSLEKVQGTIISSEKGTVQKLAEKVKQKHKEFGEIIDRCKQDEFEVGTEYDVYSSIRLGKIDQLAQSGDKGALEEYYTRMENFIASINERKKTADESWAKWRNLISQLLEENNEVYTTSLATIPVSLRSWALAKYMKENGEGVIIERDALKKKRFDIKSFIASLIEKETIEGAVTIKDNELVDANFAEGSSTVRSAIMFKVEDHLSSLEKSLGKQLKELKIEGERSAIQNRKHKNTETFIFADKKKINEAISIWNTKAKLIE